jgi:hypothetical protein
MSVMDTANAAGIKYTTASTGMKFVSESTGPIESILTNRGKGVEKITTEPEIGDVTSQRKPEPEGKSTPRNIERSTPINGERLSEKLTSSELIIIVNRALSGTEIIESAY